MAPRASLIIVMVGAMLVGAVPAWAGPPGAGPSRETAHVSPDRGDRAIAARYQEWSTMLDRRERALTANSAAAAPATADPVRDDRFRLGQPSVPTLVAADSSGEIEWLQVGVGFGVGAILVAALVLALRAPVRRPAAH